MRTRGYRTTLGALLLSGLAAGCNTDLLYPTIGDVKTFAERERELLDRHDANMSRQHTAMHPEAEAAIKASRALFQKDMDRIGKEVDAMRGQLAQAIQKAAAMAVQVAGLGTTTSAINGMVGENRTDINSANTAGRDAANSADAAKTAAEAAAKAAAAAMVEAKALEASLATFSEATQEKMAAASMDSLKALVAAGENTEERERVLREELKMTPEQIEKFKGMTTEGILGVILAAGGAAGIGIAGGKGGRSRSHVDIEKIKETIASIKADVERERPPTIPR